MHTSHRTNHWLLCKAALALLATLAPSAFSQIGPNPGEIPEMVDRAVDQAVDQRPVVSREPSTSQLVRPAIDEILLAKARQGEQTAIEPSSANTPPATHQPGTVAADLRGSMGSMPIGSPEEGSSIIGAQGTQIGSSTKDQGWTQTIVALVGVLLLILGLAQLYKRLARSQGGLVSKLGAGGSAPSGIIEVIGRYPLSKGMMLVVLRFDRKVLLLSHASSGKGKGGKTSSMQTLCELTDPEDVASILLKARTASGDSIAQSFEQTLRQADDLTDESLHTMDLGGAEINPVRYQTRRTEPVRTISNDEGDRAELWSSGQDSRAAANVLRRRLASMRRQEQG